MLQFGIGLNVIYRRRAGRCNSWSILCTWSTPQFDSQPRCFLLHTHTSETRPHTSREQLLTSRPRKSSSPPHAARYTLTCASRFLCIFSFHSIYIYLIVGITKMPTKRNNVLWFTFHAPGEGGGRSSARPEGALQQSARIIRNWSCLCRDFVFWQILNYTACSAVRVFIGKMIYSIFIKTIYTHDTSSKRVDIAQAQTRHIPLDHVRDKIYCLERMRGSKNKI